MKEKKKTENKSKKKIIYEVAIYILIFNTFSLFCVNNLISMQHVNVNTLRIISERALATTSRN